LLVQVAASALNRADLLQARGLYPAPPGAPADIPGMEYAGEVVSGGPGTGRFRAGDRVMGLVPGGAFSQRLVTPEVTALPVPARLSLAEAAAVPEAFFTAYDALVLQGGLAAGETVLVHAAASGVGTAAVQLGVVLEAKVIGTVRSPEKVEAVRRLGAQTVLLCERGAARFADRVRDASGGRGADVALELVGGPYLPETARAMASQGRILLVGLLAGREATLELSLLLSHRLRLQGTVMRSRPLEERARLAHACEQVLLPLLQRGELRPVVQRTFPFSAVAAAVAELANDTTVGKLVLTWEEA
jgi:putative PIG3 family NAD(P)H quinone oxidoreductase